jgi:hypothetical protein
MRQRPPGSLRLAAAALLLALVAVTVPLKGTRHVHEAPSAGLYNADHVLAGLEFLGGDGPLPDLPAAASPAPVVAACVLAGGANPSAPPLRLAGSRAPPA